MNKRYLMYCFAAVVLILLGVYKYYIVHSFVFSSKQIEIAKVGFFNYDIIEVEFSNNICKKVKVSELKNRKFMNTLKLFGNRSYDADGNVYFNGYSEGRIFSASMRNYKNGVAYLWNEANSKKFIDEYDRAVMKVSKRENSDYTNKLFFNVINNNQY